MRSVIVASGSYVPENIVTNESFLENSFFEKDGTPVQKDTSTIIKKFSEITEIEERRYASPDQNASDLGFLAAQNA
jgi:3-oxoacyl-[acyl-carrier-protein] synthase-3